MTIVYVHPAEAMIEQCIEDYLRHRDRFVFDSEPERGVSVLPSSEAVTEQEESNG